MDTVEECLLWLGTVHNGVVRCFSKDGGRYVRVAVEDEAQNVLICATREVITDTASTIVEAANAARSEYSAQTRRSTLKAV
jgi:hypothetical protein